MSGDPPRPSVSVVIPLYNKGDFVEEAVRSALAGPTPPMEVIVVDDGSTDDGPERVEAFGDPRVRLLRQENAGVSAARNRGLELAQGDLVAFLDADDVWLPEYLSSIVDQAVEFPDCGILTTHYFWFTEEERFVPPVPGFDPDAGPRRIDGFYSFWFGVHPFCMCSCAFRRQWVLDEGIRFPVGESHGEDQDFIFQAADRWALSFEPRALVGYRRDVPGQLSKTPDAELPPFLTRLRERLESGAVAPQDRGGVRRILSVSQLDWAFALLLAGRRREAFHQLTGVSPLESPRYWSRLAAGILLPGPLQRLVLPARW